jgi:uncharacterized protein (TIGR02270 family)
MASSLRAFNIGLYQEHLEEAAFLYEQRLALLRDPKISWREIGWFEDRLEAHVDGLVVGADLALEVCRTRAKEGEPGELFPIVSVFCRLRRADLMSELLAGVDFKDPGKIRPVEDALKYELPQEWSSFCEKALARRPNGLSRILANVAGYRRLAFGQQLGEALTTSGPGELSAVAWAVGRLGAAPARDGLLGYLRHDNVAIKSAVLLALLRLGAREPLQQCEVIARSETWPLIGLGLGGSQSASDVLREVARSGHATPDCLLALALLGEVSALQVLYDSLAKPELAEAAAVGLDLIAGAQLSEDVFVPEQVVEDELFENELKAWKEQGQAPKRTDGRPFGTTVKKPVVAKDKWKAWFAGHAKDFDASSRYRNGKRYSPRTLLEQLLDDTSTYQLRQLAAEELAIRYECPVPFEADMPVAWQLRALRDIGAWVEADGSRFEAGRWYFAGQPV